MQQATINFNQTTALTCDACGHMYFTEALHIRKIPALLVGSTKPGLQPIPVFQCAKCGHVNDEFMPQEMRAPQE